MVTDHRTGRSPAATPPNDAAARLTVFAGAMMIMVGGGGANSLGRVCGDHQVKNAILHDPGGRIGVQPAAAGRGDCSSVTP